jgi:Xaa-Pro aminopeptidase
MDHGRRRQALNDELAGEGIDALVVTDPPNVRYLTGFTGSNGQVLIAGGDSVFFTDGRYTEQSRHEVPDLDRITYPTGFAAALADRLSDVGALRLGFEADHVTVRGLARLAEPLATVDLVETDGLVARLRWVKDAEELALLDAAQAVTDRAFEELLDVLAVGRIERDVAIELEQILRREGADGLAFDPIVAFGPSAAEPHHEPGHRALEEHDVIKLDFGALVGGYHADMTRTVAFGTPSDQMKQVHALVREAQQAGIDAVRAGVKGSDVDQASRAVIEAGGYAEAFSHGLGHGVGLEIHEGPTVASSSRDVLPAGSVVTVEPGIYLPGLGGVRIEDMVEVTDDGCRVLGSSPRELIEL